MLKNNADLRTLLWMVTSTALFFFLWNSKEFIWWLYVPYLYFAICFSVFAHNHNHVPIWKNKFLNQLHSFWITIFYGFPIFAWIPTHNRNHHRYNNTEPDHTKTYMLTEKNNLWSILTYPTLSGIAQQKAVFSYYKEQFGRDWGKFTFYTFQILILITWIAVAFILDWQKALIYVFIPQQVSLNVVLVFNYIQHVHADEESKYNHSRNIVGRSLNFFLFNNGLHTIHHFKPLLHWSETPAAHKEIEHLIDPALKEKSFIWYLFRVYVLGIFFSGMGTKSMRLERMKNALANKEAVAV